MTITKSPVSTCGVKIVFSLPRSRLAALTATPTEHLVLGVDEPPFARHFAGLGRKRFHLGKRA